MRRIPLVVIVLLLNIFAVSAAGKLKIGDVASLTDVKMLDVSGEKVALEDVRKENGLVLIFSGNTCPFVKAWEGRFSEIKDWAHKNKVGFIVVNSNHTTRDGGDSYEKMKVHAKEQGYDFNYVVDEKSKLANAYGGQTTPHAFLFDKNMKLVYKGAIDDNYKNAEDVKKAYLKEAISAIASGKEISRSVTKPMGCSIKRFIER